MARFDKTIASVKELVAALEVAKTAKSSQLTQGASMQNNPMLVNSTVAQTLAEMLKSDNATTQAIAVRLANLAKKYPNKAY